MPIADCRLIGGLLNWQWAIGIGHWIEVGVGEAVVDLREAGGAGVGEPGELEGGGFLGEDAEAVVGHVHGEVDEDVDVVGADLGGELVVGEVGDVEPVVGERAEFVGDVVGAGGAGVDEDFELLVVVVGEEGVGEEGLAVVVEVGAEVGDAEAAGHCRLPIANCQLIGRFFGRQLAMGNGQSLRPGGVLVVDGFGGGVGVVVEGVEEAALGGGVGGV